MIEETGGMQGTWTSNDDPFLWGGGSLDKAIETVKKYKDNPSYQPTEDELKEMANFVVTHGGRAILNDMVLRGYVYALGGRIGNLIIKDNGIYTDTETGGSIRIAPNGLVACQADGSFIELGTCASNAVKIVGKGNAPSLCYADEDKYKIAAQISAEDGYHAIHCLSGVYAGLRPNIRRISSSAELDELDHTIVISNNSEIALTFPFSPQTGQTYKLIHTTSNKVVFSHSNNQIVIDPRTENNTIKGFSERTTITLTYLEGVWYAEFNN